MPEQTDHDLIITLHEKVNNLIDKVSELTDDHETRIRALERKANEGKGGERVIISIISIVGSAIVLLVLHHFGF